MSNLSLVPVVTGLAVAACVPVAIPPTSASIQEGVVLSGENARTWVSTTRLGIDPLQGIASFKERSYDGGFGLIKETGGPLSSRGWYLNGAYYPFRSIDAQTGTGVRLGLAFTGDVLYSADDTSVGFSISPRLDMILSNKVRSITNCRANVKMVGENSLGLQATLAYRSARYWTASIGLVFRLPAAGGIVSVPTLCDDKPANTGGYDDYYGGQR